MPLINIIKSAIDSNNPVTITLRSGIQLSGTVVAEDAGYLHSKTTLRDVWSEKCYAVDNHIDINEIAHIGITTHT